MSDAVAIEKSGRIATVVLRRAAIDTQTAFELRDALESITLDDELWVAILTGGTEAFCLGASTQESVSGSIAALQKPVIAAINGEALDQGLEIALACDLRVASSRARFGLTHVERGLIPSDGGTQRLPRLIGRSRAMEMLLTSRIVDAQEALEIGLVNELAEPDALMRRVSEIASTIAAHGPLSAGYLKEAILTGMDMTLEQGLRLEADLNFLLQTTSDRAEGISSFLERRAPEYRGE